MKVDGSLLVDDPADAGPAARRLEQAGYAGGFSFEGRHDPFFPLVVAAQQTEHLELMPAIAIAFSRNPMTLANLGHDLQLLSKGRFILGLGTQIRPHIERRFSMTWSRPAARMRELVLAIRAIWDRWQNGTRLDFRGEFYNHTLMTPVFDPGPNPYGLPRIFCAGVGPRMTEVVGEVADGFFVHPFHTPEFVRQVTLPALERGRAKAGRELADFEISCQLILVTGRDEEQFVAARNGARAQISFYGSTPAYRPVLETHGYGALQDELNRLSKQGKWLEMAGLVDDDLLEKVAVVAPRSEVAARVRERCAGWAGRVSLVSHFAKPDLLHLAVAALHGLPDERVHERRRGPVGDPRMTRWTGRNGRRLAAIVASAALAMTACPFGPLSGGRLGGEVYEGPPPDWEFVEKVETCQLETNPDDDPHSVNTWCVGWQGDLYVPTSMILGPTDPSERQWVQNVQSEPDVRIRIAGVVYELEAEQVDDDDVYDSVLSALDEKYGVDPADREPEREIWIFRLHDR